MIEEFVKFAKEEIAHGGPEPELAPIVWLTKDWSDVDKVWAAGVYCSHHVVPSTVAILQHFPKPQPVIENEAVLAEFLIDHWHALPVRNEMRSHRMPEKRLKCLFDFAVYALEERWRHGNYDDVWNDSIASVKYFGRYVAIKYMEFLRRMVRPDLILGDVRAHQAWSVREGLSLLFPETESWMSDREDNTDETIEKVESRATALIEDLKHHDVNLSHFDAQVLLCEFKQMTRGTFYAGKSHDEEYDFAKRVETHFQIPEFWEARKALFPHHILKELQDGQTNAS